MTKGRRGLGFEETEVIHALVPTVMKDALIAAAQEEGCSTSHLIRTILKTWLQSQGKLPVRGAA